MARSVLQKISQYLKIHPDAYYVDKSGKVIIRTPQSQYNIDLGEKTSPIKPSNYVIHKSILHYEDKIPRKPLLTWLSQEANKLTALCSTPEFLHHLESLATTLNQVALITAFTGDLDQATNLCKKTITLFSTLAKQTAQEHALIWCVQPWINLARINKIQTDWPEALSKLSLLSSTTSSPSYSNPNSTSIRKAINTYYTHDIALTEVINNCLAAEPVKIYLEAKQYQSLLTLTTNELTRYPNSIILEGKIIALTKLGQLNAAMILSNEGFCHGHIAMSHLFAFRRAEILQLAGATTELTTELDKIYLGTKNYDFSNTIDLNELHYTLAVCRLLQATKRYEQEIFLLKSCYQAYEKIGDQIGQINSLNQILKNSTLNKVQQQEFKDLLAQEKLACDYCFINKEIPNKIKLKKLLDDFNTILDNLC